MRVCRKGLQPLHSLSPVIVLILGQQTTCYTRTVSAPSDPASSIVSDPEAAVAVVPNLRELCRDLAEIGGPHGFVVVELLGGAFGDNPAGLQYIPAVGDGQCAPDLVAEGNPAHVQAMPEVARIYLGEEWLKTKVLPESGDHRVGTI